MKYSSSSDKSVISDETFSRARPTACTISSSVSIAGSTEAHPAKSNKKNKPIVFFILISKNITFWSAGAFLKVVSPKAIRPLENLEKSATAGYKPSAGLDG